MAEKLRYITIVPTNKPNIEGYKEGKVTCFGDNDKVLGSWICDSIQLFGEMCADFEADGGIKIWSFGDKPIEVDSGNTTRIWANK